MDSVLTRTRAPHCRATAAPARATTTASSRAIMWHAAATATATSLLRSQSARGSKETGDRNSAARPRKPIATATAATHMLAASTTSAETVPHDTSVSRTETRYRIGAPRQPTLNGRRDPAPRPGVDLATLRFARPRLPSTQQRPQGSAWPSMRSPPNKMRRIHPPPAACSQLRCSARRAPGITW
jgi:hypothetical protein